MAGSVTPVLTRPGKTALMVMLSLWNVQESEQNCAVADELKGLIQYLPFSTPEQQRGRIQ